MSMWNDLLHLRTLWKLRHEPHAARRFFASLWFLLIVFWVISFFVCGAYGFYVFSNKEPVSDLSSGVRAAPDTLNRSALQEVLDGFEQKKTRFEERKAKSSRAEDPSVAARRK